MYKIAWYACKLLFWLLNRLFVCLFVFLFVFFSFDVLVAVAFVGS